MRCLWSGKRHSAMRRHQRKCSPEGEHFAVFPVFGRVMYMGESDSTASQPPKPCDWILGRQADDVKEKTPGPARSFNLLRSKGLLDMRRVGLLSKMRAEGSNRARVFGLRARKAEAYLLPRWSVIIALGSSWRPNFRARIRIPPKPIPATRHSPNRIPVRTKMLRIMLGKALTGFPGTA